jgi:hypothetical protein
MAKGDRILKYLKKMFWETKVLAKDNDYDLALLTVFCVLMYDTAFF